MDALRPELAKSLGISTDMLMVWFGALVAVVLQTAFLSPPVAMSAYYLKQVVKDWSLATIYKGMFEFMLLQIVAIALIIAFPSIATYFPRYLQEVARSTPVEQVDDGVRLEDYVDDPYSRQSEQAGEERRANEGLDAGQPTEQQK